MIAENAVSLETSLSEFRYSAAISGALVAFARQAMPRFASGSLPDPQDFEGMTRIRVTDVDDCAIECAPGNRPNYQAHFCMSPEMFSVADAI